MPLHWHVKMPDVLGQVYFEKIFVPQEFVLEGFEMRQTSLHPLPELLMVG
jgi:hypothetical protein